MEVKKIHLCRQKNYGHGITQSVVIFSLDGRLVKAKVIERVDEGVQVYDVHLVREGKIITVRQPACPACQPKLRAVDESEGWEHERSERIEGFTPAQCLVDQAPALGEHDLVLKSPLAGLVVKIKVTVGQFVTKNQPVVVIESMKMENEICAPFPAFIKTLSISEGNLVKPNQVIVTFERRGGGDAATKRFNEQEVFER